MESRERIGWVESIKRKRNLGKGGETRQNKERRMSGQPPSYTTSNRVGVKVRFTEEKEKVKRQKIVGII